MEALTLAMACGVHDERWCGLNFFEALSVETGDDLGVAPEIEGAVVAVGVPHGNHGLGDFFGSEGVGFGGVAESDGEVMEAQIIRFGDHVCFVFWFRGLCSARLRLHFSERARARAIRKGDVSTQL